MKGPPISTFYSFRILRYFVPPLYRLLSVTLQVIADSLVRGCILFGADID